jgi:hypothetical protein
MARYACVKGGVDYWLFTAFQFTNFFFRHTVGRSTHPQRLAGIRSDPLVRPLMEGQKTWVRFWLTALIVAIPQGR